MGELSAKLFRSFRVKVLIPVVTIMVGVMVMTAWLVNASVKAQFKEDAAHTLETAEAVFQNSQLNRTRQLLDRFTALPHEPRYRSGFQSQTSAILREMFKDVVEEQDVDVVLFTLSDGSLLAHHKRRLSLFIHDFRVASDPAIAIAAQSGKCVDTVQVDNALYDIIAVDVRGEDNVSLGILSVGREIGKAAAEEFSVLTRSEILFLAGDRVTASTLPQVDFQPHLAAIQGAKVTPFRLGGERFYASTGRFRSLTDDDDLSYVILSAYGPALRALHATQSTILGVSLVGILVGGTIIWFFIRRVVEPLEQLHDSVEAVGRGDFTRRVELNSNDECGRLAVVFNRMVENLRNSRAEVDSTLAELKSTQFQLIQSERLSGIGEFVAGVAHELNNPLTTVMGFSELLQKADVGPRMRVQLDRIHASAKRCQKIVQGLLSFARRHTPERRSLNLNSLARDAAEFLEYQMQTSNIEVEYDFQADLPGTVGDSHQIHQVLVNILNNARQAIEGHQSSGNIRISTRAGEGRVRCVIEDNGPGIPPEFLTRIFDPFFTTKEVGKGTGLGLSICFGIIKEHGGNIAVSSRPGKGARFVVELPATSQSVPHEEHPSEVRSETEGVNGRGQRILVVDDEEGILEMMEEILSASGFVVETVMDGQSALKRLKRRHYDLTLCDWRMPGLNGRDVYEQLAESHPDRAGRIVFMTGDVANEATQEFIRQHRCTVISKPFTLREFHRTFERMLPT